MGSEGGLLAPGPTSRAFPARVATPVAAAVRPRAVASPVTVAGPRRSHTGFPVHRPCLSRAMLYRPEVMTVNLTRIYTRLGDGGETHLGDMSRVPKTDPRIEAYGTVDELNAAIGVALALPGLPERFTGWLQRIQNDLFDVGADLSVPLERRPVAAAGRRRADRVAGAGLRRGQRRAAGPEVVRASGRGAGRRAAARLPDGVPARRAASDRVRRRRERRVRALPEPPLRPACSSSRGPPTWPRATRSRCGNRAATAERRTASSRPSTARCASCTPPGAIWRATGIGWARGWGASLPKCCRGAPRRPARCSASWPG